MGDSLIVAPSGLHTRVRAIRTHDGDLPFAQAPKSIGLLVRGDIDIGRGDLLASPHDPPLAARHLEATICWFADAPFDARSRVLLRHGTRTAPVRIDGLTSKLDFEALEKEIDPPGLERNDVADVGLTLATPIAFDRYRDNRRTGGFLLIDEQDGATLGAGIIC